MPKQKRNVLLPTGDWCDELDWIVDLLGDQNLLESFLEDNTHKITADETKLALQSRGTGLHFKRGHWYCKMGNKVTNSYSRDHQIKGTAHFCQTFALMYYLDRYDENLEEADKYQYKLKEGEYQHNIRLAIQFWLDEFKKYPDLREWFIEKINEYKDDQGRTRKPLGFKKTLETFNYADLKRYLNQLIEKSDLLIGCMQS